MGRTRRRRRAQGFGGHYLSEQKIQRVIASASPTLGVRMSPWQVRELQATAEAIGLQRQQIAESKQELKKLTGAGDTGEGPSNRAGQCSVLWMCQGDVGGAAYRKAMGLNLRAEGRRGVRGAS